MTLDLPPAPLWEHNVLTNWRAIYSWGLRNDAHWLTVARTAQEVGIPEIEELKALAYLMLVQKIQTHHYAVQALATHGWPSILMPLTPNDADAAE